MGDELESKLNKKYAHLILKVVDSEYKYSLFENEALFIESISSVIRSVKGLPYAVFSSSEEYSAIIPTQCVVKSLPGKDVSEWSCFRILGEMPFGSVQGLIATVASALRSGDVGTCVVSTYKTDLFFVRTKNLNQAKILLENDGWVFG